MRSGKDRDTGAPINKRYINYTVEGGGAIPLEQMPSLCAGAKSPQGMHTFKLDPELAAKLGICETWRAPPDRNRAASASPSTAC